MSFAVLSCAYLAIQVLQKQVAHQLEATKEVGAQRNSSSMMRVPPLVNVHHCCVEHECIIATYNGQLISGIMMHSSTGAQ